MSIRSGKLKLSISIILLVGIMLVCPFSSLASNIFVPSIAIPATSGKEAMYSPAQRTVGDWPAFRNDEARTGMSNTEGPDTSTVLWQNTTDDVQQGIYSSAAVAGGKVFFGSTNSKFYAYDAVTGYQLWNNTTASGDYGICSSPVVSNGYVIIYVNQDDSLYSFNVSTGALRWKVALGASVAGGSSPVVSNGKVYVGAPNGRLYVRNENDGSAAWNFQMESANQPHGVGVISSPAIYNNTVFFGGGDYKFYAVNITTHNKVWSHTLALVGNPSPAVVDGVVYYAEGAHTVEDCTGCGVYAFDVDGFADGNDGWTGESATGATDADIIWKKDMAKTTTSSPAVYGNYVFIGSMDNYFYALNRTNGNTIWSYDVGFNIIGSPSVADGKVFVPNQNSKLFAFDIDGFADGNDGWDGEAATGQTNGDIIWNYSLGGQVWASPAISNGVVYLGNTNGKMYAIGTPAVDTTPPQVLTTDPANGAKNITLDKTISARFNEGLGPQSVTIANFTLRDSASIQVTGTVSYQAGNNEIRFDPVSNIKPHETYTATITSIRDLLGNTMSVPYSWTFTTLNMKPTLSLGAVTPATGNLTTQFQYSVVFTDPDNDIPTGGVKVHIDGNATGKAMIANMTAVPATLHDGDYTNGEAYICNHTFTTVGTHNYQFKATDGIEINVTQVLNGPQVTIPANKPPVFSIVPDQNVVEGVDHILELGPYISDPDNSTSELELNATSAYIVDIQGLQVTLLFPHPAIGTEDIIFTVTDGSNAVQRTVKFIVPEVHGPPVLTPVPDLDVDSNVPLTYNLTGHISDIDTPITALTVTTNSSYIQVGLNATALFLTLEYPEQVSMELVNLTVEDEYTTVNDEFYVTVHVPVLNQPPTIDHLTTATAQEDVELIYDLTGKVHDDGLPNGTLNLSLKNPSDYVTVVGLTLKMLYPEGVTSDTLTLNVSDGDLGTEAQLSVVISPVNDAPVLQNGNITYKKISSKCGGADKYQFQFVVTVMDVDSPSPTAEVIIDGQTYPMVKGSGNSHSGYLFTYTMIKTDLKKGPHTYKFKVDDKSGAANAISETPVDNFDFKKVGSKCVDSSFLLLPFLLLVVLVIVIIGVIALAVVMKRKRGGGQVAQYPQQQTNAQPDMMVGGPGSTAPTPQVPLQQGLYPPPATPQTLPMDHGGQPPQAPPTA